MSIRFFAFFEKIQSLQKQNVPKKYKPLLRISHTIMPEDKVSINEYWQNIHKQLNK
jgi:hypothetical protein